ncbi:DUF2637 domain-containing protein [Micromonospora sp. CA-263727]|uniref:DUF2637 domain-containing protein n=1 Tax=Micromonospora sp. CA-263727 TaxID=3239967 RepID=UPI003D8C5DD6
MTNGQLVRMQWAVRATLALGVAASVTANILHAQANPISQTIAAWPPLALLITVELVTRIPVHHRALGAIRIVAATAIAAIAAFISYHHMVGVVARYGETGTVPYLLPLSVDGLIIVASVSLVELAARRRDAEAPAVVPAAASTAPVAPGLVEQPPDPGDAGPTRASRTLERQSSDADTPYLDVVLDPDRPLTGDRSAVGSRLHANPDSASHDDDVPDIEHHADKDVDLTADLVPLLSAARTACDELIREGQAVSRDALARRLRSNGYSIRNSGVSELLAALRQETPSVNGSRPTARLQ